MLRSSNEERRRSRPTSCKRGHALTPANTLVRRKGRRAGQRECRTCIRVRRCGRPEWVEHGRARVSIKAHDAFYLSESARFKGAMLEAHPDRHMHLTGRAWEKQNELFRKARDARQAFHAREAAWYQQVGLTPPGAPRAVKAAA